MADKALLGKAPQELVARVELAIDHHGTHVPFAPQRWVEADSAATVELIYALLGELGVELDRAMADCLYTGLATDTGCFRYRNVTPRTHRIAADLLELGAQSGDINQRMFESKSRGVEENDLDGIASLPREIQGVVLGITLKEKEDGKVKVSVRANPPADASVLCARLGGGGHQGAAGCSLGTISLQEAQEKMEQACGSYLEELGLL